VGGILFPWMIGEILDSYKAAGDLQGGYHLIFSICGGTYLLTLGVIHKLTKGKDKVSLSGLQ
jgi:ACS family hexuronate transporter-like MFS transporter